MKNNWRRMTWIAGLVVLISAVGVGSVAFAQSDNDTGWPFDLRTNEREAIADVLGITVEEYETALDTAESQVIDEAIADGWLTEDQAAQLRERLEQDGGFGGPGMGGQRGMGLAMGPEVEHVSFFSVAAELLDLSDVDLQTELQVGKTIAELAEEKGVDPQAIVDEYVARYTTALNAAVEAGDITQEQADAILGHATQRATDQLENAFGGRMMGDLGRGGGRGGMRGMPNGEAPGGMRGGAPSWDSDDAASSPEIGGL